MKNLFPEYDEAVARDYSAIWEKALFVFDTNVLLNLYRYRLTTREELINVLENLGERIWVPHHVALEFQRNRLSVVAEQNRRFTEVRSAIAESRATLTKELDKLQLNKRHSLINPELLTSGFDKLVNDFLSELAKLEGNQQKLNGPDPLKTRIEELFTGRVGPAPGTQKEIDELYKCGETRYKAKIPPGYEDDSKDRDDTDEYSHGGIIYKRKYGDFLVWSQLLGYTSAKKIESIVFVTDDNKEDWWRKAKLNGPKTIGPRPELIDEARRVGAIKTFLMYNPENFLKFSKNYLRAAVSEETLEEVRDISNVIHAEDTNKDVRQRTIMRAMEAVFDWLTKTHNFVQRSGAFPDYTVKHGEKRIGYEVVLASANTETDVGRIKTIAEFAAVLLSNNVLDQVVFILITATREHALEAFSSLKEHAKNILPVGVRVFVGVVDEAEGLKDEFSLQWELNGN